MGDLTIHASRRRRPRWSSWTGPPGNLFTIELCAALMRLCSTTRRRAHTCCGCAPPATSFCLGRDRGGTTPAELRAEAAGRSSA